MIIFLIIFKIFLDLDNSSLRLFSIIRPKFLIKKITFLGVLPMTLILKIQFNIF